MSNKQPYSLQNVLNYIDENFALIIIAIVIFGLGFVFGSMWQNNQITQSSLQPSEEQAEEGALGTADQKKETPENVPPVNENDHLYGADNPAVTIFEYSDFGCPFSGRLHPTLKQLVDNYPTQVTWVYRHFLLGGPDSLTGTAAQISECVAQNHGPAAFWQYINLIYEKVNDENRIDTEEGFYTAAKTLGFNETNLRNCVDSEPVINNITNHIQGGREAGVGGTPAMIIMSDDEEFEFMSGAVPYERLESTIEQYL